MPKGAIASQGTKDLIKQYGRDILDKPELTQREKDLLAGQKLRVNKGDNLLSVANQYGVTPQALQQANGLSGGLTPGQTINIPAQNVTSNYQHLSYTDYGSPTGGSFFSGNNVNTGGTNVTFRPGGYVGDQSGGVYQQTQRQRSSLYNTYGYGVNNPIKQVSGQNGITNTPGDWAHEGVTDSKGVLHNRTTGRAQFLSGNGIDPLSGYIPTQADVWLMKSNQRRRHTGWHAGDGHTGDPSLVSPPISPYLGNLINTQLNWSVG